MATDSPFLIRVYDKSRQWQGNIGAPEALTGSVLRHGAGSFQLTLDPAEEYLDVVMAKGSRIAIDYLGVPLFTGMRRGLTGPLVTAGDAGSSPTCTIQGDRRVLDNHLALVAPSGPIMPTALSGDGALAQAVQTGAAGAAGTIVGQGGYMTWPGNLSSAESLVKWVLAANLGRAYEPVTIKPDKGRGGNARAAGILPLVRMASLTEAIQPILDWSGLVVTALRNEAGTIEIDVHEPDLWPGTFTAESGVLTDGTWSVAPPTTTRVIVGGPGQDAARAFYQLNDATGLEAEYGDSIETFRDATGAQLTWPQNLAQTLQVAKFYLLRTDVTQADKDTFVAYLRAAGADGLADGLPLTSITASLSESEDFRYGGPDGLQLGDEVTVQATSGAEFTDVVTEAKFSYTASGGLSVTPILGDLTDRPERKQANLIARLFAAQRRMARNR